MNKKILFYFVVFACLTACTNQESVYDPSYLQEIAKTNFPVKNIDPNQDWNMVTVCSLSVSVNQNSNETYSVKVYSENPFDAESKASLMTVKENVSDGSSFNISFDIPKALQYVYVVLEDSKYNKSLKTAEVTNSAASVSWGDMVSKSARSFSRSEVDSRSITLPENIVFATQVPDGAIDMNTVNSVDTGHAYYLSDCDYSSNIVWNTSGISLYIKGHVTFNELKIPNNYKVYILPDANVKINSGIYIHTGANLYVGANAKIEEATDTEITFQSEGSLFNKGFMQLNRIQAHSLIYNEGDISCPTVYFTNSGALYNLGGLTCSSLKFDSSAQFENQSGAIATINGELDLENAIPFNNNGKLVAETLKTTSGAVINNKCSMHITKNTSSLEQANITVDGGCYLYINGLSKLNNSNITLGNKSLLVIDSPLTFNGGGNTLTGPSSGDRALFYVNGDMNAKDYGILKCSGNVDRTSTKDLSATQIKGSDSSAGSVTFENVKLGQESGCSRSFTTQAGGTPDDDTPQYFTFAFEDMFKEVGDYDFNDVVVKVSSPSDGKIKVILAAAGATKDLKVYYRYNKGQEIALFGGKEVHEAFGVKAGTLVNTGSVSASPVEEEISVPQDFSISKLDVYIKGAEVSTEIHIPAYTNGFVAGNVPYSILVPVDWDYPTERECVITKYPDFVIWAQDATKSMDWYNK